MVEESGRHLALVGTTASGKSAVAMEVARRLGDVELVSVDSMQVYRRMDIGTAKPSPADQAEVPHHLIDLVEPHEDFSVSQFQAAAIIAIAEIESRGHRALLVGGTGLHFRAVVDGLTIPGRWPDVRAAIEADLNDVACGVSGLYARLAAADPVAASRMEPTNARRIVRALEVTEGSGRPFSSFGPGLSEYVPTRFDLVGLWLGRDLVGRRITQRLGAQMAAGFLDEVRSLVAESAAMSRTARQALGYRELLSHIEDGVALDVAVAEADRRTRSFARRQESWFRRDPRIRWLEVAGNPVDVVPALLGDWEPHGSCERPAAGWPVASRRPHSEGKDA